MVVSSSFQLEVSRSLILYLSYRCCLFSVTSFTGGKKVKLILTPSVGKNPALSELVGVERL